MTVECFQILHFRSNLELPLSSNLIAEFLILIIIIIIIITIIIIIIIIIIAITIFIEVADITTCGFQTGPLNKLQKYTRKANYN